MPWLRSDVSVGGRSGYAPGLPAGSQKSSPPPRITSGWATSMYWRAISLCSLRSSTCDPKAAGEASVTCDVVTSPVAFPDALASSSSVVRGSRSGPVAIAPL